MWSQFTAAQTCVLEGGPGGVWLRDKARNQRRVKVRKRAAAKIKNCFSIGLGRPRLQAALLQDPPELGETKRLQGAGLRAKWVSL